MNYLCIVLWVLPLLVEQTPLDDYVNRPEPAYNWVEEAAYPGDGYVTYVLNMTSQIWLTENEINQPLWWHHVIVTVPDILVYYDAGFLMVDNGNLDAALPTPEDDGRINNTIRYALGMGAVAVDLKLIPNQRLHCAGDPVDRWRREDDLIAWTWRRYVNEGGANPDILLQLPMVKAVVKAMDAVTELVKSKRPAADVEMYMLGGGSKRGWTANLAAAVDPRVFALNPSVITCVNFIEVMNHQYQAYGGWSFSNGDYYAEDLTVEMNEPILRQMMDIIDPYVYNDRLSMPKLIISASQDEHFMPDDTWYFWDDLVGPKYYWMLEETGHSIGGKHADNMYENRITFFHAVKTGFALPVISWTRSEDTVGFTGSIDVTTDTIPLNISVWYGDTNTPDRRDFRQFIGIPDPSNPVPNPIIWTEEAVEDLGEGTYRATYSYPPEGWRCFFIKMVFAGPIGRLFITTTETNIIPDYLPYPRCEGEECRGSLL